MKRVLGEYVMAVDPVQIVQEMKVKRLTYNILKDGDQLKSASSCKVES